MDTYYYYSYGSNMSTSRITGRACSARFVTVAWLDKHKLKFHKKSKDGSGKCDAEHTNNKEDFIYGVVFQIDEAEKSKLDRKEGLHCGYLKKTVSVTTEAGETLKAEMYYATNCATNIDPLLEPYDWYKEHVLRGAHEHGLPSEYIATIDAVNSKPDPCTTRRERELSIYR
jgi:gamma-glutamylcyclotransferase